MRARGIAVSLLSCLALAGCGQVGARTSGDRPFTLPVGPSEWDTSAPAWFLDGTLHVGDREVELGDDVEKFALGATGAYWMRQNTLMFTDTEGGSQEVADVRWGNLAVSADHTVFATVDQSRGPTDDYGTHVIQVAAFDTRSGEQLYRTPDEEPDGGDDLADLYGEIMPLLHGVSDERLFFDGATIDLRDGSSTPAERDDEELDVYAGYGDTLFPDGYHVGVRGEGRRRVVEGPSMYGAALLSPDRSTIFDTTEWPTAAVVYDARSGHQRPLDAPWDHFTLGGWSDPGTFFGVAQRIDVDAVDNVLREQQVVTCELATLACTPLSPAIPTGEDGNAPLLLTEGSSGF